MDIFLKTLHSVVLSWCDLANYLHLKIFKSKCYSSSLSFESSFFVPILLDEKILLPQPFLFFPSFSFSMQNTQVLPLVSLKKNLNWPNIQNSLFLQNDKIIKRANFVTGLKIFTGNTLIVSTVFIWHLPIVSLLSLLPVLTHSRYFFGNVNSVTLY